MAEPHAERAHRVLVVERVAAEQARIVEALRRELPDASAEAVSSGEAALARLAHGSVDVLLADVDLPDLDWRELARRLQDTSGGPRPYVVLIADALPSDELDAALDGDVDDCLFKPYRVHELIVRVRAGLRRRQQLDGLFSRLNRSEQLYSRQTEFLSTVSHEIRTPLSAIMSSANILLRYGSQKPESVERFARVIHEEGQRLTRLINNLLDLAKIESGEVEWRLARAPVAELVEKVAQTMTELARERSVTLQLRSTPGLDEPEMDLDRITQVVVNLVSNAIKYSPVGGTVWLRVASCASGGVRIEVEDEGDGIPPGMEERVFGRFQQLGWDDRRTGTGLGLAISREIIDRHGGRIFAAPGRTRGALFVVELPPGSRRVG